MLQEAAQKIRKLRSEYKRRMDAEAKVTDDCNTLTFLLQYIELCNQCHKLNVQHTATAAVT
jgi:hypothetical protein